MQHIEHLQFKRREIFKDRSRNEYLENKQLYKLILSNSNNLPNNNIIMFSPPSRFDIDISEYREAIKSRFEFNSVKDITDRFKKRNPNILCGEGVHANEKVTKNLEYHCQNDEHEFRNIVIVDDIYSTGRKNC
jgi:predicted amidophosphoribosyltransferase